MLSDGEIWTRSFQKESSRPNDLTNCATDVHGMDTYMSVVLTRLFQ
jgi:hypothetical protein